MQRIFNTGLFLFHLDFGCSTDLDDRHTAGQLGNAFLHFFFVVIRGGFVDLYTNLVHPCFDLAGRTCTIDHRGVFLANLDTLRGAKILQRRAFEAHTDLLRDHFATGQNCDVLQHGFTTVTESGRFHCAHLNDATHVVHHQRGQRFAFDVLGNHEQRTPCFGRRLKHRQHVANVRNLLVVNQDQRVIHISLHRILIVNEVGRQITAVELHAFYDIQLIIETLAFFDRNHTFFANFFHRFSNDAADGFVCVGRHRADLGNFLVIRTGLGNLSQLFNRSLHGLVDTPFEIHRVHTGGNRFKTLAQHGLGQYRRGGRAVARYVGSLGSNFLDHLGAHVFEFIFELDFLCNRDTVFGDGRRTKRLVEHNVTALGAQRNFYGVCKHVDATQFGCTSGLAEFDFFS